jgi:hypothetical protein
MSKNDDDPMKKILERRKFIEDDNDDLEVGNDDPFSDIPDRAEQPSKKKEEIATREKVSSPAFDLGKILRRQMGIPEEEQVREKPKVGKLRPEAIEALANAKAEDARRAAEREESPGETRVSVTSAELQKGSDIPIPPAPPPAPPLKATEEPRVSLTSRESIKGPEIPVPPSPPPAPPLKATEEPRVSLTSRESVKGPEIPIPPSPLPASALEERRTTVAMEEPPIPSVEKRKTTVSKIPGAEGNKDLDIVIKDLEQLQQEVSDKIGPKNTKELASKIDKIKEDYNAKSGEEQTKTLYKNLQSLKDWSSEKGKKTNDKSTWKKIGTVISSCISLVAAKIAGKEVETIKNNLAQAMKELKTQGKKEVVEGLSKINTRAAENQQRGR